MGVLYILDEPSIGLHQRTITSCSPPSRHSVIWQHPDRRRARRETSGVRTSSSTSVRAGERGGEVIVAGTLADVLASNAASPASTPRRAPHPIPAAPLHDGRALTVTGATENNLKSLTVQFPSASSSASPESVAAASDARHDILYRASLRPLPGQGAPGKHEKSRASSTSTRSSTSTSRRSPDPRSNPATTWASSPTSATSSPSCPRPRYAATSRVASPSTSPAGGARPARATG